MSEAYEMLEVLQEDVIAILQAVPDLDAANIISEQNGDLESEVERILGFQKGGPGGKRGLAVIVMMPEVTEAESNLPGPPFLIRQEIQIIEHPRINRTTAGTNLRSSHAALLAMNALHLHCTGPHSLYADEKPITPLPMKDGLVSHVVGLSVRANGLQGPGKVLGISADLKSGLAVTGITHPLEANGGYTETGVLGELDYTTYSNGTHEIISATYDEGYPDIAWFIQLIGGGTGSDPAFRSENNLTYPVPENLTWTGFSGATGTPVVERVSEAVFLSCGTEGASIYYTTDGAYPTPDNGTLYVAPFTAPDLGTTIRAAGYKTGLNPGDCLEFTLIDRTPDGTITDGDLALADADGTILTDL